MSTKKTPEEIKKAMSGHKGDASSLIGPVSVKPKTSSDKTEDKSESKPKTEPKPKAKPDKPSGTGVLKTPDIRLGMFGALRFPEPKSLSELKGFDFRNKWFNSDIRKTTDALKGVTTQDVLDSWGIRRPTNARDAIPYREMETRARQQAWRLHDTAEKERARQYAELRRERLQSSRGTTSSDKPSMKDAVDAAKAAAQQKADSAAVAPVNKSGEVPPEVNGTQEPVTPPDTNKAPAPAPASAPAPAPAPVATPSAPSIIGPVSYDFVRALSGDIKGGYSSLGSDGRYHRFSAIRADAKGGMMGYVNSEATKNKYLGEDGSVTKERQAEIDKVVKSGGRHIFVNGVDITNKFGEGRMTKGPDGITRTSSDANFKSDMVMSSADKTGAGNAERKVGSGRRLANGAIEFSGRTEKLNKYEQSSRKYSDDDLNDLFDMIDNKNPEKWMSNRNLVSADQASLLRDKRALDIASHINASGFSNRKIGFDEALRRPPVLLNGPGETDLNDFLYDRLSPRNKAPVAKPSANPTLGSAMDRINSKSSGRAPVAAPVPAPVTTSSAPSIVGPVSYDFVNSLRSSSRGSGGKSSGSTSQRKTTGSSTKKNTR